MARMSLCIVAAFCGLLAGCSREAPSTPALQYASAPESAQPLTYAFAVHPLHNPEKLQAAYGPLMAYLNRQMPSVHFELEASRDYASFEQKLARKSPAFALPNPWQTLGAMKDGYRVIAMAGDEAEFKGVFLIRKDSPIRTPADLKGKAVSYPSPTALAACILPQYFLYQHGLDINQDIQNRYVGSQESSIMNVLLGEVAVGVTWTVPWRLFQKEHPEEASQLRVIWETTSLKNNSVMVRSDVPADIAANVSRLLLAMNATPEGQTILAGMATRAFHPANNDTYQPVARFISDFERDVRKVTP